MKAHAPLVRVVLAPALALLLTMLIAPLFAQVPSSVPPEGIRERTPAIHALTNAKIVTAPGKVIEKGTIVFRDGVIIAVGADVKAPADARVWDMTGRTIYPGLIDAFSELSADASNADPAFADLMGANYWNSNIAPHVQASRIYRPDTEANRRYRAMGFVARLAAPSRGLIKGTSAVVTTSDETGRESIIRPTVAQHMNITLTRSFGGGGPSPDTPTPPATPATPTPPSAQQQTRTYPTSPMGAYALVRQAMYDAQWYASAQRAWEADPTLPRPERNDALAALAAQLEAKMPFIVDANDELFVFRAEQIAQEFGLNIIVRGSGQEFRRVEQIKALNRPMLIPVNFPRPPSVTSPEAALTASLESLMEWDLAPENPARLAKAGVKFAIISHGLRDRATFLSSVRRAVARGLKAQDALAALTTVPAEILGISKTHGTLEVGKNASMVVADGELFNERTRIIDTWVDGRRFEVANLPNVDVRGRWSIKIGPVAGTMNIRGELERMTGRVSLDTPGGGRQDARTTQPATAPSDAAPARAAAGSDTPANAAPATQPSAPAGGFARGPSAREADMTNLSLRGFQLTGNFQADRFGIPGYVQLSATVSVENGLPTALTGHAYKPDGSVVEFTGKFVEPAPPSTGPAVAAIPGAGPSDSAEAGDGGDRGGFGPEAMRRPAAPRSASTKPATYEPNYPLGDFGVNGLPEQPAAVLFTNATVWTSGPQGKIENASVLVRNGKIAAVGRDIPLNGIDGLITIDCKGKHISPGLIDCHSHIATDGGINEGGRAITSMVRIGDFVDPTNISIYRQIAGGTTTANILHGSANPIGGQNQVIKLRWGASGEELKFKDAPQGIKFALGENVKQSNSERSTRYPQTRMGVDEIIRDEFRNAVEYKRQWEQWNANKKGIPPRRDLQADAIVEILDGKRWIHCHSYRQDEILALMKTCDEFAIKIGTFQHILEGYKVADEMAKRGIMASSFSDWWAYKVEVQDAIPYAGALMHNAGVVVSFNSDDGELARRMNLEAAKAVKYGGIKPEEALKFVTLNPARQLRIDQYTGSLEVGKDADLVVWSASPLSVYAVPEQTWIDGRKYFDRQQDLKQREEFAKMRRTLIQKVLASGETAGAEGEESSPRGRDLWPDYDEHCGFCEHK